LGFPVLTERIGVLPPMPGGRFRVAALARLAHLTQGQRVFTL
jgi:hypothetical protein